MLVLSRQRGESIMIGDDIEIMIVDIRGDKVRLGINAPRGIQVHRKEIYEAIKAQILAASRVQPSDIPQKPGAPHKGEAAPPREPPQSPPPPKIPPHRLSEPSDRPPFQT